MQGFKSQAHGKPANGRLEIFWQPTWLAKEACGDNCLPMSHLIPAMPAGNPGQKMPDAQMPLNSEEDESGAKVTRPKNEKFVTVNYLLQHLWSLGVGMRLLRCRGTSSRCHCTARPHNHLHASLRFVDWLWTRCACCKVCETSSSAATAASVTIVVRPSFAQQAGWERCR